VLDDDLFAIRVYLEAAWEFVDDGPRRPNTAILSNVKAQLCLEMFGAVDAG
jgi:hypothetical protein